MADFVATQQNIFAIFKEVYGPRIEEQPNREAWIMNLFDRAEVPFGGKYWTEPAQFEGDGTNNSGPGAVGSYNEDEEVADAGAESYKELQIRPKQHYALVQITGLAQAAARANLYAFISTKDAELKNKVRWLVAQLNAQCYQNGNSVLGRVGVEPAANQWTIASTAAGNDDGPIPPMTWFRIGQKIDVWTDDLSTNKINGDETTKKEGRIITNVVGRTITYSGTDLNGTTVANETGTASKITYEDGQIAVPAGENGKTLSGLSMLIDDITEGPTTVQNISRATFPGFKGNVLNSGVTPAVERELSLDILQQLLDTNRIASGMESDFLVSNYGIRRKYLNLLWHNVRYAPQELKGGFVTLQFDTLTWYVDKDCRLGSVIAGYRDAIKKYVIKPIGILDEAGSQAERVSKKDIYEFLIGGYFNLGITRPNSWGKEYDLVDPLAA